MTTAPLADQRRLLDVQELDTRLAQLAHQRRTHPSIAALAELEGRAQDLAHAKAQAGVGVRDIGREVVKAETDVDQVRSRAERDNARLTAGQGSAKDMQALTSELEVLARRQDELEEIQLEVMERLEAAEKDLGAITSQEEAVREQVHALTGERDSALADLDAEIATVQTSRDRLAEGIDAPLLALYEKVRGQTGGLAAVALRGESTVGIQVPLSLTERDAIRNAGPDEVIRSEDYGYLLIPIE